MNLHFKVCEQKRDVSCTRGISRIIESYLSRQSEQYVHEEITKPHTGTLQKK